MIHTRNGFPSWRNAKFEGGLYSRMTVLSLTTLCSDIISHQNERTRATEQSILWRAWTCFIWHQVRGGFKTVLTLTATMKFFGHANHTENVLGIFTLVSLSGVIVVLKCVVQKLICTVMRAWQHLVKNQHNSRWKGL